MKALQIHPVQTESDWAELARLLRAYATQDLDPPHLSTIWNDLRDLPARYSPPQGLASQLMAALLQHARQAGYTHAALSTWRSNLQGQALYARLGFKPVPPFKEHPNPDLLFLGLALPDH